MPEDGRLTVRTDPKALVKFKKKTVKQLGKTYPDFVREIITAFNEDRLRIIPAPNQPLDTGNLYHVN